MQPAHIASHRFGVERQRAPLPFRKRTYSASRSIFPNSTTTLKNLPQYQFLDHLLCQSLRVLPGHQMQFAVFRHFLDIVVIEHQGVNAARI